MKLSALYHYPIKSCAPLPAERLALGPRGPEADRRWMVVDADGRFVTGRQQPRMVLLQARPQDTGLALSAPGLADLHVATPGPDAARISSTVWKDCVDAQDAGDAAAEWLSAFLGQPVRLVHMDQAARRPVSGGRPGDEVSFADGYPLLLVSQAALDALSARVGRPMAMTRFRPNLVVEGCAPHAEDGWRRLRIGGIELEMVKPCTRCAFTTIDPDTAERDPDGEPLRSLGQYRRGEGGVLFGVNLIARGEGDLRIGDAVEVVEGDGT